MKLTQKLTGFLSVSQKDKRSFLDTEVDYDYSLVRICLLKLKVEGENYILNEFVKDKEVFDCERDVCLEVVGLEAGDYLIYIEFDWCSDQAQDFVVSSYSNIGVVFAEVPLQSVTTVGSKVQTNKFIQQIASN